MGRYYKKDARNIRNEQETPHVYPGHGAGLANQEGKWGEIRNGKVYFVIYCSVCNYGLCKHIEIYASPTDRCNDIMVDPCPKCAEARETGEPVEILAVPWRTY